MHCQVAYLAIDLLTTTLRSWRRRHAQHIWVHNKEKFVHNYGALGTDSDRTIIKIAPKANITPPHLAFGVQASIGKNPRPRPDVTRP